MTPRCFEVRARDGAARCGTLHTDHGSVETPAFMPVGTRGTVKTLGSEDLDALGLQLVLANTYHLYLRPGAERVSAFGGLHGFMSWHGALLTDSGGYQVMSLADLNDVDDDGVTFRSHLDGSSHRFTPEMATRIQAQLGADIIMCFDECLQAGASREAHERAVRRTSAWARRCRDVYGASFRTYDHVQRLFGIVQGGTHRALRERSAEEIQALDLPGYAIGGLAVGEPKPAMLDTVQWMHELLDSAKPRYLMGVGYPEDLVRCVARGVDLFDCVLPTRNARNGMAFTSSGRVNLRNAVHADDAAPLDARCDCGVCGRYSRAYLRHLHQNGEILGLRLVTYHNVWFYTGLMRAMRAAIAAGRFSAWESEFFARYDVAA